jgi:hypothetical protein
VNFFLGVLIGLLILVTLVVMRVSFRHNPPDTASTPRFRPDRLHSPPRPPTRLRRLLTVPAAMELGPASTGLLSSLLAQRCRSWVCC